MKHSHEEFEIGYLPLSLDSYLQTKKSISKSQFNIHASCKSKFTNAKWTKCHVDGCSACKTVKYFFMGKLINYNLLGSCSHEILRQMA